MTGRILTSPSTKVSADPAALLCQDERGHGALRASYDGAIGDAAPLARTLEEMSEALLLRFTSILNEWERQALVPPLWTTMFVFIPKPPPDKGRRPIGLLRL